MGLFQKEHKESASDVRELYADRIYQFLERFKATKFVTFESRGDPLAGLFTWVETRCQESENPQDWIDPEIREFRDNSSNVGRFNSTLRSAGIPNGHSSTGPKEGLVRKQQADIQGHASPNKKQGNTEARVKRLAETLTSTEAQVQKLVTEKQEISRQLFNEKQNSEKHRKNHQAADAFIGQLRERLKNKEAQIGRISTEKQGCLDRITEMRSTHESENREAESRLQEEKRQYENQKRQAEDIHRAQMLSQKEHYDGIIDGLKDDQRQLSKDHEVAANKLKGQLLVNQKDNQDWPGEKIKLKFSDLQRLINSVTSTRNREFLLPSDRVLPVHLDTSGFIHRAGKGKSHFLLKGTIWSIICEQFFSVPFGFGVFGPRESRKEISELFFTWRKQLDGGLSHVKESFEDFGLFQRDELANNWRSATFQCINAEITGNQSSNSSVVRASNRNVDLTARRILAVLSELANLSHATVKRETEDQVYEIAKQAEEIALQTGVNSAQLSLLIPGNGQQIRIGDDFHDCEDGNSDMGAQYKVDLVTAPGIQKIGDGKSDMKTVRTIVPCEIYPLDPN